MLKILLLALLCFLQLHSFAQQCGFDDYYLFVVNPHWDNSTQKLDNLKMYLVDENEKPITAIVTYREKNNGKKEPKRYFFGIMKQ